MESILNSGKCAKNERNTPIRNGTVLIATTARPIATLYPFATSIIGKNTDVTTMNGTKYAAILKKKNSHFSLR